MITSYSRQKEKGKRQKSGQKSFSEINESGLRPPFLLVPFAFFEVFVSELDEQWAQVLAEAERRARSAGRGDLVEYLRLRASNDRARSTGMLWLFETFTNLAGEANRAGAAMQISKKEGHRFEVGSATMVGVLLTLKSGVRQLMIEAGWPRAPRDGFVPGNGLASGQIRHFGIKSANDLLLLVRSASGAPQWLVLEREGTRAVLSEARIRQHLGRLLNTE
jgi:hypothetical protein